MFSTVEEETYEAAEEEAQENEAEIEIAEASWCAREFTGPYRELVLLVLCKLYSYIQGLGSLLLMGFLWSDEQSNLLSRNGSGGGGGGGGGDFISHMV